MTGDSLITGFIISLTKRPTKGCLQYAKYLIFKVGNLMVNSTNFETACGMDLYMYALITHIYFVEKSSITV